MLQRTYGTVAYGGTISEILVFNVNVFDTLSVAESATLSNSQLGNINLIDIVSITESLTIAQFHNINVSDIIAITESATLSNSQLGNISLNEVVLITESLSLTQFHSVNTSDVISITEDIILFETEEGGNINISDIISIEESLTVSNTQLGNINLSDLVTVTESVNINNQLNIKLEEIIDQSQLLNNVWSGFGEFSIVRYRGMGFIPTGNVLTAIDFQRGQGSKGIKIYIDTANVDSIPTNPVGSELYSFTIPNTSITGAFQKFTLPIPLSVTPGSQYVFYIAPWDTSTNSYADDYQDMRWQFSDVYSGGKGVVNNNGTWSVSDLGILDAYFNVYTTSGDSIGITESISVENFRFSPGRTNPIGSVRVFSPLGKKKQGLW